MPILYRSRSVRRFNEANCRLTSLIENHSTKILAAASIQLFVSTHQLEKWFKSSTGTLCFLKDINRKSVYYFRLYSLMQGQLWEQEIQAPFVYKKLSPIFHYLTVNRFNFGFKFICEDEAERFYSAITKFSSLSSPSPLNTKKLAQTLLLNSTTNSNGYSIASISNPDSLHHLPKPTAIRTNSSNPPLGSISNVINQSSSSSTHSLTGASTPIKANFTNFLCSKPETSNLSHKPRRIFHSSDRSMKQKIRTSDISCPFRCSRKDLNTSSTGNTPQNSPKANSSSPSLQNTLTTKKHQQTQFVQRTYSSASIPNANERLPSLYKSPPPKLHSSLISSTHSSSSLTSLASLDSQRLLVDAASTNSTLKNKESPSSGQVFNKRYSGHDEDLELEATKQILIEYGVAINRRIIKDLRNYISKYGGIERFQESLKVEIERSKLNLFIASASAGVIKAKSIPNNNNYVEMAKSSSPGKFQSLMPPQGPSASPTTPHKSQHLRHAAHTPYNGQILNSAPTTPNATLVSTNSTRSSQLNGKAQFSYHSTFQMLTPISAQKSQHQNVTGQPPVVPQSDRLDLNRTPVRLPNHLINLNNRNQTPSPSRSSYQLRQQNLANITSTPSSLDAPPKPPRHTSLKATS